MRRDYGIDLLKVVAMLMVVILHIVGRGGVTAACAANPHSAKYIFEQLCNTFCSSAVDCFVLASGFIMSQHTFRYARIARLWALVVFYSVCIVAIATFLCPWVQVTWRDWVSAVLPIGTNQYWFVTMYVALFFTMPLLNHLLRTLSKRDLKVALITGFVMFSAYPSIVGRDLFWISGGYSYLWFMYLYLVAGYIAQNKAALRAKLPVYAAVIALPALSFALHVVASRINRLLPAGGEWGDGGGGMGWIAYSSPGVFLHAVALLVLFSRLSIPSVRLCRAIGLIGPSVFSVYAIHSNPVFRKIVCWNGRFSFLAQYNVLSMLLGVLGCALIIFIACVSLDIARCQLVRALENLLRRRGEMRRG